MPDMHTFRTIIDLWGAATLADDLNKKSETVRKWRSRNSIPATEWDAIVRAAKKRGFRVNVEQLSRVAAQRRST